MWCRSTELVKNFTEDCYSVSVHPNGLTVLLGFADKLRLMTVLMDDLRYAAFRCCLLHLPLAALCSCLSGRYRLLPIAVLS